MSDTPHLQPSGPGDGDEPDLAEVLGALLGGQTDDPRIRQALASMGLEDMDPAMLQMVQAQVQAMMSGPPDGPFDADLATDVARRTVAGSGDRSIGESTARDVREVVQVAQLWLDAVTDLAAPAAAPAAWSRAEWVEATMPLWRRLVEPVAAGVGAAIRSAMQQQLGRLGPQDLAGAPGIPAGLDPAALAGQMEPVVARMSSAMFGMQVGQAVGALAGELVTGTEVGLPLVEDHAVVVLPANVTAFAEGLGVDAGEVHLYLAVREAARQRLFARVGWIGPALLAAVQTYAGDIRIDTEAIEQALSQAELTDPAELQKALSGSLFTPEPSEAQQRALTQLERLLALVEGWVDQVAQRACEPHLPHTAALAEAVRRRRAAGGPAERIFSSLVGLELRPRRLREAANLWAALEDRAGAQGRDEAWSHPDAAPTADDLDDPLGYVERRTGAAPEAPRDEMDAALDALLVQGEAELASEREGGAEDEQDRPGGGPQAGGTGGQGGSTDPADGPEGPSGEGPGGRG